jgi:hypothetical protein
MYKKTRLARKKHRRRVERLKRMAKARKTAGASK